MSVDVRSTAVVRLARRLTDCSNLREPFAPAARLFFCRQPKPEAIRGNHGIHPAQPEADRAPASPDAARSAVAMVTPDFACKFLRRPGVHECLAFFVGWPSHGIQVLAAACLALNQRGEGSSPSGPTRSLARRASEGRSCPGGPVRSGRHPLTVKNVGSNPIQGTFARWWNSRHTVLRK